jgi:hypothetical protein
MKKFVITGLFLLTGFITLMAQNSTPTTTTTPPAQQPSTTVKPKQCSGEDQKKACCNHAAASNAKVAKSGRKSRKQCKEACKASH